MKKFNIVLTLEGNHYWDKENNLGYTPIFTRTVVENLLPEPPTQKIRFTTAPRKGSTRVQFVGNIGTNFYDGVVSKYTKEVQDSSGALDMRLRNYNISTIYLTPIKE